LSTREDFLRRPSVRRVQAALVAAGSSSRVIPLAETARTAEDAAQALGCALGQIVKSLVFTVGGEPVMALVAGDHRCETAALKSIFGYSGKVRRADAETVRATTGFAIGGVAPVGHDGRLPTAIDASLKRFDRVYAAAGHPHCVFATTVEELQNLTGGIVDPTISS
jgi:prolyl-tRNA editing enzyme YbaK/EbsC (Cys-tRNA(Pro) deacylase)